jgi:hypothetical protein
MASTIKLINTELLDYGHVVNLLDGGMYQFGRTVSLGVTAFILPLNSSSTRSKFKSITNQEKAHLQEILDNGFADSITFDTETIHDVKILSYDFPKSVTDNQINLERINLTLEFYEAFDNRKRLKEADDDIYTSKSIEALQTSYARYFEAFSENYSFSIGQNYEYSFNQNVSFTLRKDSAISPDMVSKAKDLINAAFLNDPPKIGYVDSRYANFIQIIKTRGRFNESYDSLNNTYTFSRSVAAKSGLHKTEQKGSKWSAGLTYSINNDGGIITVTETGSIKGRLQLGGAESAEDLYSNAYDGFEILMDKGKKKDENGTTTNEGPKHNRGAYKRCQELFKDFVKTEKPDWLEGSESWDAADDLKIKFVTFGKNLNRVGGTIGYNISFTNNPRMHEEAMFEYTLTATKDPADVINVTESGTITPYDENRNALFNPKPLYDRFTAHKDVLARIGPLHTSLFRGTMGVTPKLPKIEHPRSLISSQVSFPAYGPQISYSFVYSDDPTLKNETYIRKLTKSEDYSSPIRMSQRIIAPNIKETNFDANQTGLGSKSISMQCLIKRYPVSNVIDKDYTDYLKTACDSVFNNLKQETEKRAFVVGRQVVKDQLSFFVESMSYDLSSNWDLSFSANLGFVDRRGVTAEALEY